MSKINLENPCLEKIKLKEILGPIKIYYVEGIIYFVFSFFEEKPVF